MKIVYEIEIYGDLYAYAKEHIHQHNYYLGLFVYEEIARLFYKLLLKGESGHDFTADNEKKWVFNWKMMAMWCDYWLNDLFSQITNEWCSYRYNNEFIYAELKFDFEWNKKNTRQWRGAKALARIKFIA